MTLTQWLKNGILGSSTPMPTGVGPISNPAWDDLRTPLLSASGGGIAAPAVTKFRDDGAGSDGVFAYDFTNVADRDLLLSVQMPHKWKVGTSIYPHVHWSNKTNEAAIAIAVTSVSGDGATVTVTTTGNHNLFTGASVVMAGWGAGFDGTFSITVTGLTTFTYASTGVGAPVGGTLTAAPAVMWRLEYSLGNTGGVFPLTSLIDAPCQITVGTPYKHLYAAFPAIAMAGMNISSILVCRMYRNPGNAVDTYGSPATALELDFHYQSDSLGSDQESSKAF